MSMHCYMRSSARLADRQADTRYSARGIQLLMASMLQVLGGSECRCQTGEGALKPFVNLGNGTPSAQYFLE